MRLFTINDEIIILCKSESTRYGFRHLAFLFRNGYEIDSTKVCYYNRTWERWTFESVIEKLIHKSKEINEAEKNAVISKLGLTIKPYLII